ncbi:unnamed protein product, partial [Staurois parvus]
RWVVPWLGFERRTWYCQVKAQRGVEGLARGVRRTLSGGQWRDWQRGVEDTEWRSVEGLAERGGGH